MTTWRWTREEWFALPLEVRQRWWRDTDYSKREPSPKMIEILEKVRRGEWTKKPVQKTPTVITNPTARCERCGVVGHVVDYAKPFPALCLPCFAEECRRVEDKTDGSISQVADYLRREKLH
jgi:hypothetical protein